MRFRIDTLLLAAIVASASLAVCAQTPPAADPAKAGVDAKPTAAAKKEADVKKAEEKKKPEEKRKADAKKKAEEKKKADEKKAAEKKPVAKLPETVTGTPAKGVKKPGSGPMIEKRTVTDKGSSPFTLTDKDGKVIQTAPDAYDVSSATTPKKR